MCYAARLAVINCLAVDRSSAKAFLALRARANVFIQERRSGLLLFIGGLVVAAAKSAEEGFNFFFAHDFSLLKAKSI